MSCELCLLRGDVCQRLKKALANELPGANTDNLCPQMLSNIIQQPESRKEKVIHGKIDSTT